MTRYNAIINKLIEMLKNDDDLFIECVEELDNWNGYADGYRAWEMGLLDEFYHDRKASDLLNDMTADFCKNDAFFYFSIWGLESCSDKAELYRDNTDEGELLDNIIDNINHLNITNSEFVEMLEEVDEMRNAEGVA